VGLVDRKSATSGVRGFVTVPPVRVSVMSVPVDWSAVRSWVTVAAGFACLRTAQAPVTCGVAMDVPL